MGSWISDAKPRSTNVAHAADDAFQGGPVMCVAFVFSCPQVGRRDMVL